MPEVDSVNWYCKLISVTVKNSQEPSTVRVLVRVGHISRWGHLWNMNPSTRYSPASLRMRLRNILFSHLFQVTDVNEQLMTPQRRRQKKQQLKSLSVKIRLCKINIKHGKLIPRHKNLFSWFKKTRSTRSSLLNKEQTLERLFNASLKKRTLISNGTS